MFANGDAVLDFDFAPDGRLAVATLPTGAHRGRLLVQRTTRGAFEPLAPAPGAHRTAARWSPDGRRIAPTTAESSYVMPLWSQRAAPTCSP